MSNNPLFPFRIKGYTLYKQGVFTDEIKYFEALDIPAMSSIRSAQKQLVFASNSNDLYFCVRKVIDEGEQSVSFVADVPFYSTRPRKALLADEMDEIHPFNDINSGSEGDDDIESGRKAVMREGSFTGIEGSPDWQEEGFVGRESHPVREVYGDHDNSPPLSGDSKEATYSVPPPSVMYIKITINLNEIKICKIIIKKILLTRVSPNFLFMLGSYPVKYTVHIGRKIQRIIKTQQTLMEKLHDMFHDMMDIIDGGMQEDRHKYKLLARLSEDDRYVARGNVKPYILFFRMGGMNMTKHILSNYSVLFRILYSIRALHSVGILHTDLHIGNMLIMQHPDEHVENERLLYMINGKKYWPHSSGNTPIIIDFGISVVYKKINDHVKERMLCEYNQTIDIHSNNIITKLKLLDYISVLSIVADESLEVKMLLEELNDYVVDNSESQKHFNFNSIFELFTEFRDGELSILVNDEKPYELTDDKYGE